MTTPMRALILAALIACSAALVTAPAPAAAAGSTLYVDGKNGSDSNSGTSWGAALKTISKAASKLPAGASAAGSTIIVRGYTDYVYRERPVPTGWGRTGTSSAPIVFRADGYVAAKSDYVKPIVSGADAAPQPGNRWTASNVSGVWWTPWTATPFDFGKNPNSSLPTAVFESTTTWLWEQPSLTDLGARAQSGAGGYWYDTAAKRLYVSATSATGPSGANPTGRAIDVVTRNGFLFDGRGGADYVQVRGFEVRHSANGIAYLYGADYGTVADNVLIGNLYMGVSITGYQAPSGPDAAVGHTVWRNRGTKNTIQMIKVTSGGREISICHNEAWDNGLQGIKVEGPPSGSPYTGTTSDVTVCSNKLHHQRFNPTGTPYNNASGLTVANGALNVTVSDNDAWSNDVGILITQEASGMPALNGLAVTGNRLSSNRRFGLYLLDGLRGSGAGTMSSSYNVIWANGLGVMVDRGSTNKTFAHETIHGNTAEGVKVGGVNVAAARITLSTSLITSNGGYGVWVVSGNTASMSYDGVNGNARGGVLGATPTSSNSQPPSYLSTTPGAVDFLRISGGSYQQTAGPHGTPIGARF
jgi:hypothetical protein